MKELYDKVSQACSELTTKSYSSSFSIGVKCLHKNLRWAIYSIYGFVRFADEIVDTFHDYDKQVLFQEFKIDTWNAIDRKISLNPILNSFQKVVHQYQIDKELIIKFLKSMETDLHQHSYDKNEYSEYIVGSAEVVGLMCLRVFTDNDDDLYIRLTEPARKLGAAFQKVNFLRDIKDDHELLGRIYFPDVDFKAFTSEAKRQIEDDIEQDFKQAYHGLMQLKSSCRFGVYVAFIYYRTLFNKIRQVPPTRILMERVRISNRRKIALLLTSYFKHSLFLKKQYVV